MAVISPTLPVQAAIGRNQATRKMPAARSSKAAAPSLQDPPAATIVSNAGGDAFRADARFDFTCSLSMLLVRVAISVNQNVISN